MSAYAKKRSQWKAAVAALGTAWLGYRYAYYVSLLGSGLGGAGEGWVSANLSWWSMALVPLTGVALVYRRTRVGRGLAIFTLVSAVALDVYIVVATASEGFDYLARTWSAIPLFVLGWSVLWLAWQIVLAWLVFHRPVSSPSP